MKRRAGWLLALALAAVVGWCVAWLGWIPPSSRAVFTQRVAVGVPAAAPDPAWPLLPPRPVRNVVLLIGDGLGLTQIAAVRIHAHGPDARLRLERFPVTGLMATHPAGGLVSKSDSGATAIASGVKTTNGRIGTAPDGRVLPTLLEWARDHGFATGLVTSSYFYDATPAAFAAHVDRRRDYERIIEQMTAAGVDLIAGGGLERMLPAAAGGSRSDGRDLVAEAEARGVRVVTDAARFGAARELPLWALFPGRDLGEGPDQPAIGVLAAKAIDLLSELAASRDAGFFLMVEEEATDSASHALDVDRLSAAVGRFDEAVGAAARFAVDDGATLVLVLADHSTGGLVIDQDSTAERLDLIWGGDFHGGEPVGVWALGPADAALRFTGLHDNTEVHDLLAAVLAAGLRPAGDGGARPATAPGRGAGAGPG